MPEIHQLPPSVVNKIAAGEVIERPASVVKELLENAVDAGATRIDVCVTQGGTELVRVSDNGCGIEGDQLHLAVASHATSKIRQADDLFQVRTLGFRGEALASIAEVSHFRLRSRTSERDSGAELEVNAGQLHPAVPCGCPVGTTVEVRNLFCNTPVRRKFLRTSQTEMGHLSEAFIRIALVHTRIHFTLQHNERVLHDLPVTESWRERIATFFGPELADGLISVESHEGDVHLVGYVAEPGHSRGNNRMQYLFLNNRHIRDRSLQHALGEAYRGLLLTGRFPIAFLRLNMPPELIDVNVHPTKLEVRFQDGGRIYSQLLAALRTRFLQTDLTARVQPARPSTEDHRAAAHDAARLQQHRRELADWARDQGAGGEADGASRQGELGLRFDRPREPHAGPVPEFKPFGSGPLPSPPPPAGGGSLPAASPVVSAEGSVKRADPPLPMYPRGGLQLHNRYLVTENEEGMVVIDQHALHERILYEKLRERVMGQRMETQRLLVPEPVALSPSEASVALEAREALARVGIEIEPFGGDTVLVSAYPAMLANLGPAEMLRQVVEQLMADGKRLDRRDLLDDLLHMISCKAAIKAGDRLSPEEIVALLEQRHLCQDAHHCPHGRPTALVFTREELDRRFKRI